MIQSGSFGEWVIDRENDGTPDHPIHMPFVKYSELVINFVDDVYNFEEKNKDMELFRYNDILKENCIAWSSKFIKSVDVSNLDEQCVLALIMGAVRAERFCDGALLNCFKSGCISKWLKRLNDFV